MKRILRLNLKKEYFDQIRNGEKTEEYRLVKPYWEKRLSREYDEIHLLCGYPSTGDMSKTLIKPWAGYTVKTITHPHFGPEPVKVFAIRIADRLSQI